MEILKKKIFSVILCSFVIHFIGLNAYAGMGRTSSGGSPLAGLVLSGGGSSGTSSSSLSSVVPIVSGAENMNNTFAGAMNYSIPIEVPRGRNGMDPGLALTYNNYVGNGWIGLGWELEVGDIERNPRFGVKLDGNDFILRKAGAVIELVPDANVTGLYHAKIEGQFNRIMQFVSSSGTYWEVTDRKGVVFRYGQATASRQDDPTGTNVFKWCLDQVVDTNGNYMTLSYFKDKGQIYLSQINYTGSLSGTQATNYVKFFLESRTDLQDMFNTKFEVTTAHRLKTIQVVANNSQVRVYTLAYAYSASTGRSLLTSVQQYDKNATVDSTGAVSGNALPARTFTWQDTAALSGSFPASYSWTFYNGYVIPTSTNCSSDSDTETLWANGTGDFNGDGKADIHRFDPTTGSHVVALNKGDGSFPAYADDWKSGPGYGTCYFDILGDFNGDGKADIYFYNPSTGDHAVWLNKGDGTFPIGTSPYVWTSGPGHGIGYKTVLLGDFNGDGKADIYMFNPTTGDHIVWLNNGDGTFPTSYTWESGPGHGTGYTTVLLGDFNGDGKTDIYMFDPTTGDHIVWLNKGDGTFPTSYTWESGSGYGTGYDASFGSAYSVQLGDFNGDGLSDIYMFNANTGDHIVWLNEGNGTFRTGPSPYNWESGPGHNLTGMQSCNCQAGTYSNATWAGLADFNGDGKADIYMFNYISGDNVVWLGDGDGKFTKSYKWDSGPGHSDWGYQLADYNGDGKADILLWDFSTYVDGVFYVWINQGSFPDLLTSISTGLGGSTTISYTPSTQYTNTLLPFPIETVGSITTNDGNGIISSSTYIYSGGYYYFPERDFRGFNYSKVTGPVGPHGEQKITETYFHQGNGATGLIIPECPFGGNCPRPYPAAQVRIGYMKGLPYNVKVSDANGTTFIETTTNYAPDADNAAPYYTPPLQTDTYIDGTQHIATGYTYDHTNGNLLKVEQYGDVNDPNDDRTIIMSYLPNTDKWILSLPASETVYQGTGSALVQVASTSYYYDEPVDCNFAPLNPAAQPPTKGNLTRVVRSLDGVNDPQIRLSYIDASGMNYGNLICTRDANGNVSKIDYDPTTKTLPTASTNALGQQTITSYYDGTPTDSGLYGQVKNVTDPNGNATTKEYDTFGRVTKIRDPYGLSAPYGTISYSYPDLGTVGRQKVVTYASEVSDANSTGCTAGYNYNSSTGKCEATVICQYGYVLNISTARCESTQRASCGFNWSGQIYCPVNSTSLCDWSKSLTCAYNWSQVTCPVGGFYNTATGKCETATFAWTETFFDGFGRGVVTRSEGPKSNVVQTTHYDQRGAVNQVSTPYFESSSTQYYTNYTYDALGRVTQVTNPDQTTIKACYNGGETVLIDPNGHRKRQVKDAFGRLVEVEEYQGVFSSCATGVGIPYAATTYQYNVMGNLRFVTDAKNNKTEMHYDSLGRKDYMIDPDMGRWAYTYDPNGNLWNQKDAKGNLITFNYDALNRLTTKHYPAGTDTTYTYDETWSTNAKGRLTTMSDASGTSQYYYDKLGRATSVVKTVDGSSYGIGYSYDGLGRVTETRYPDGEPVRYGYDTAGNITLVTGITGNYAAFANYNALGQTGTVTYGNGVTTTYTYQNTNNRLSNITANQLGVHQNLTYDYDNTGNIMHIIDNNNGSRSQTFAYDELNRLTQATSSYGALSYIYDQIGNIMFKEGVTYDEYGRNAGPHAVTHTSDGKTYIYDANGNMTTDGTRNIVYDYNNMPNSISDITSGGTVTFIYDGNGERAKKITLSGTTVYVEKLYECRIGVCTKYIFAGNNRIAQKAGSSVYYYHRDHLESTSIVSDQAGNAQENIFYYPFGGTLSDTGGTSVTHKYTSQEMDGETGLYYYGARHYNPVIGRFISADSIVPTILNPQSLNRYAYVLNSPVIYMDPTGHAPDNHDFDFDSNMNSDNMYYAPPPDNLSSSNFNVSTPFGFDVNFVGTTENNRRNSNVDIDSGSSGSKLSDTGNSGARFDFRGLWSGFNSTLNSIVPGARFADNAWNAAWQGNWGNAALHGTSACLDLGLFFLTMGESTAAKTAVEEGVTNLHHALPKFLGGDAAQELSTVERGIHTEFHSLLRQNLRAAGLPNVGGIGGSRLDWADYMYFNPGAQRTALDVTLDTSRAIDFKYGTNITHYVWDNILEGRFRIYP